jgi:hypothetical protein
MSQYNFACYILPFPQKDRETDVKKSKLKHVTLAGLASTTLTAQQISDAHPSTATSPPVITSFSNARASPLSAITI